MGRKMRKWGGGGAVCWCHERKGESWRRGQRKTYDTEEGGLQSLKGMRGMGLCQRSHSSAGCTIPMAFCNIANGIFSDLLAGTSSVADILEQMIDPSFQFMLIHVYVVANTNVLVEYVIIQELICNKTSQFQSFTTLSKTSSSLKWSAEAVATKQGGSVASKSSWFSSSLDV